MNKINIPDVKDFGKSVDFGKTAGDYRGFRRGFPDRFFEELISRDYIAAGQTALDIGTGTGTVAIGLSRMGLTVTGIDPAMPLLEEASDIAKQNDLDVEFRVGTAENIPADDGSFDVVTAGQCWHWFDRHKAVLEVKRILRPGGRVIIAHFDWLPIKGSVVEATEKLILSINPKWALSGGCGIYTDWLSDLGENGFEDIETFSFDQSVAYSHEAWRGRIRASAGVMAHLSEAETNRFDGKLAELLESEFPQDPLSIPHRVWMVTATTPHQISR